VIAMLGLGAMILGDAVSRTLAGGAVMGFRGASARARSRSVSLVALGGYFGMGVVVNRRRNPLVG
jgi:hypothetical protein